MNKNFNLISWGFEPSMSWFRAICFLQLATEACGFSQVQRFNSTRPEKAHFKHARLTSALNTEMGEYWASTGIVTSSTINNIWYKQYLTNTSIQQLDCTRPLPYKGALCIEYSNGLVLGQYWLSCLQWRHLWSSGSAENNRTRKSCRKIQETKVSFTFLCGI